MMNIQQNFQNGALLPYLISLISIILFCSKNSQSIRVQPVNRTISDVSSLGSTGVESNFTSEPNLPIISAIIHGHKSPFRPFYANILTVDDHGDHKKCGGTIVRAEWIVTAAKCVHGIRCEKTIFQISFKVSHDSNSIKTI